MPQITIIIPLYNKGPYVRRALDSVFAQNFQDYEVIVVDDGSTDDGPEQVTTYKDSRLRLIQQPNAGPGAARNLGIQNARGDYIAFLDADDEWFPGFLSQVFDIRSEFNDIVMFVASYCIGREKIKISSCVRGEFHVDRNTNLNVFKDVFGKILVGTVVCKKDICLKYEGFLEDRVKRGEDNFFWLKILINHKIYLIDTPFLWYHHENSELFDENNIESFPPYILRADSIRYVCPKSNLHLLELFLGHTYTHYANCLVNLNNIEYVIKLKSNFKIPVTLSAVCFKFHIKIFIYKKIKIFTEILKKIWVFF